MELQVPNSCYFSCEIICSWWISIGRISDRINDSSIKQHSLILWFLKIHLVEGFKAGHIWYKDSTWFFFKLVSIFSERRWKNRNEKDFLKSVHHVWVGKHCVSNGHGLLKYHMDFLHLCWLIVMEDDMNENTSWYPNNYFLYPFF